MRRYLPVLLLLLFCIPACGTMANLSRTIQDAREIAGQVRETMDKVQPQINRIADLSADIAKLGDGVGEDLQELRREFKALDASARKAADKDGDGELSWSELIVYLLGVGGGGTILGRKYLQKLEARLMTAAAEAGAAGAASTAPVEPVS